MREDWVEVEFNDVLEIISGKNQKQVIFNEGKYPIYGSGGIIGRAKEYLCEEGTTVVGRKGTINSPIYVKEQFWNVDTAFGLTAFPILKNRLLYFYAVFFNFKKLDKSTTIPSLAKRDLLKIKFPLAPLPIQRAIVAKIEEIFSALDKGIADLKKAQAQLKIYRQAVLKKAFEGISETITLEDIKQESLIGLVRSSGLQNSAGEGVGYLKMDKIDIIGNVNLQGLVYVEASKEEIEKYSLKTGDILLNTRNSYELVGKTGIVRTINETVVFNNNIMRIRVKDDFNPLFIGYQLISPFVRKQMEKYKKATTSVCALYQRNLFPLKLKTTVLEEQHQIVQEIESRLSVCDTVEQTITESLEKAKALRQSILKKAFEGSLLSAAEIAVCKAAPDYEPASVLLEKMQAEKAGERTQMSKSKKVKR